MSPLPLGHHFYLYTLLHKAHPDRLFSSCSAASHTPAHAPSALVIFPTCDKLRLKTFSWETCTSAPFSA